MNLARHYRTLGLRPGSSGRELKAAYRQLVRRYHPDINPDKQAVERFIKINDAYTAISEVIQARARRVHRHSTHSVENEASPGNSSQPRSSSPIKSHQSSQSTTHSDSAVARDQATGPKTTFKEAAVDPLNLETLNVENLKIHLEKLGIGKFSPSQTRDAGRTTSTKKATETHAKQSMAQQEADLKTDQQEADLKTDQQEADLKQEAYRQLKGLLQQQKYPRAIALVEGLAHRMPNDAEISQWQAIVYQRWGRMLIGQGQTQKARIYLKKALRTDPNNPSLWSEVNRDFWQLANLDKTLDQPASSTRGASPRI